MLVAFNTFFETRGEAVLFLLPLPWFSPPTQSAKRYEHLTGFGGFLRYHGRTYSSEGPPMKLQQLVYVTKVAECGSITEAARRLYVSQPSITSAIHDLEQEMNVHIFDRTNKGVVVSEEGETFLGYARQVLEQTELLEDKYKNPAQRVPHFSVSCQHYSFAVNAFVDVIREFDAARYDFTLREGANARDYRRRRPHEKRAWRALLVGAQS